MKEKAEKIRLIAIDVDGVLTDGKIIYSSDSEEKQFAVVDGMGITLARRARLEIAFISVRESEPVSRRATDLGIIELHQGVKRKWDCLKEIMRRYGFSAEEVAYIGDDIVDVVPMRKVGLPIAVANAMPEVKEVAVLVTESGGGEGAVREAVEAILKAKGVWEETLNKYLAELE
ncbi:3-deoxy-D-manno-octulosonate 8-phosphate phosphatase [candidate division TA06 bacterium]|uniref:3-deoxy-D-manno-octulosonate 8-phosphate phosphatase KdsC n=1 Tax=candidate division TA06 bacterium TaxID=2250710 RepID=A0A523XVK7_UNCT6|nr:MAG: 3-deoxy-D-manno-octulosonate 8-phosphate phosphatase [candidate division TA06 bacterium]